MEQHLCACGCGQTVNSHAGKGRPNKYFSGACRVRAHRNKGVLSVTKMPDPVTKMRLVKPPGPIKPIVKWPGAKWSCAKWIISHFPEHRIYLEPYCGSAAVFFSKAKSEHEVLGDADGNIINFFTVLRERGPELATAIALTPWAEDEYNFCEKHFVDTVNELERARRFLVRCWQAHGTLFGKKTNSWRHKGIHGSASTTALWHQVPERLLAASYRLKDAEIRNRAALELVDYYHHPDCLIYADPPYLKQTCRSTEHYAIEMTDDDHIQMLLALSRHPGPVVLSGYDSELYNSHLPGWQKVYKPMVAERATIHVEVLWLNPRAVSHQQLSLFEA